jgi:hypothetical protein
VFSSQISGAPNPATTGATVSFTAAASDPESQSVTYLWIFGDGANATGANVSHAYSSAGTFSATVTVIDGNGGSVSQTISVVVSTASGGGPVVPPGINDDDGDGVDNNSEKTGGTNPNNPQSFPGGPADGDADGVPDDIDTDDDGDGASDIQENLDGTDPWNAASVKRLPMIVSKLSGSVNFNASNKDACSVSGVIPGIAAGFDPIGIILSLDIGGAKVTFVLDAKGRGKNAQGSIALKLKPSMRNKATKVITFLGGDIAFKAKLAKGSWTTAWSNEGIDPAANKTGTPMSLLINVDLGGTLYGIVADVLYSSKAGNSGKFKK